MFKSGTFSPRTQDELSATLDITWQALSEARRNMRLLAESRDRAEGTIARLKEELARKREETSGLSGAQSEALRAELASARGAHAKLAREKELCDLELAEAREEIGYRNIQLVTEGQLVVALRAHADLLDRVLARAAERIKLTQPAAMGGEEGPGA